MPYFDELNARRYYAHKRGELLVEAVTETHHIVNVKTHETIRFEKVMTFRVTLSGKKWVSRNVLAASVPKSNRKLVAILLRHWHGKCKDRATRLLIEDTMRLAKMEAGC